MISTARNDPAFPQNREIDLYGPGGTGDFLQRLAVLYRWTGESATLFRTSELTGGDRIRCSDSEITALEAVHGRAEALSYRMESGGSIMVYTGDTALSDRLIDFCRGVDLVVAECSFPDNEGAGGHMTVSDVGKLASEADPARLVLVHMYPQVDPEEARAEVSRMCRSDIIAGRDGLRIIG
jgi:phosphoribosyl 1,2-cyclic phosphodiesterase